VSWHPHRRARHVRQRVLQALEEIQHTGAATARIERELSELRSEQQRNGRVLELVYEQEMHNIRELWQLRQSAAYAEAFTDEQPLISVIIPTYLQTELLVSRAIPSILAQTYPNIEVVIVGDGAPPETARAIERLDDPRIRYSNLTVRAPYPEDPSEFWMVAGTPPWNAAWQSARGRWIAPLNDDDAFRPTHIELLLDAARAQRCEVAYGAIKQHQPDGTTQTLHSWPPESHRFGWQAAIVHAGLRFMPMQLGSGALGVPGDWSLCRRMLRAGVSFAKVEEIVIDYYPSLLWDQQRTPAESQ
jgi:cellulose synthase/poly-beta-1,6-N-acetylglucosamine synthase-like glycosyltransferase